MTTETTTPPAPGRHDDGEPQSLIQTLIGRISRLEIVIGAVIAALMALLVIIEPNILEAPFENANTILFTVGGTLIAALAFVVMLWLRVPAIVRVIVLVVPFAIVNWWLLSPYFIDDVVDEEFSTSIAAQVATADETTAEPGAPVATTPADDATAPPTDDPDAGEPATDQPATDDVADEPATDEPATDEPAADEPAEEAPPATEAPAAEEAPPVTEAPTGPVLLGFGQFVGLAGHDGVGDAGIFRNPDGSLLLRFENFDIENGPDLEVYLVPGADQVDLVEGSIHLGALKGNIGDQNYELPAGTELAAGEWTVLVWCEAFSVEFVGATLTI